MVSSSYGMLDLHFHSILFNSIRKKLRYFTLHTLQTQFIAVVLFLSKKIQKITCCYSSKNLVDLGNVMEALDRKASHVPYRDIKLSYLLQESLGGNMSSYATWYLIKKIQFRLSLSKLKFNLSQKMHNARKKNQWKLCSIYC